MWSPGVDVATNPHWSERNCIDTIAVGRDVDPGVHVETFAFWVIPFGDDLQNSSRTVVVGPQPVTVAGGLVRDGGEDHRESESASTRKC